MYDGTVTVRPDGSAPSSSDELLYVVTPGFDGGRTKWECRWAGGPVNVGDRCAVTETDGQPWAVVGGSVASVESSVAGIGGTVAPATSGIGATDRAALQALISAMSPGDVLTLRSGEDYVINDALTNATSRITIRLNGATITQTTVNKPIFDNSGDDVEIDCAGSTLTNSATRAWSASSFRGDGVYLYSAAIWSSGARCRFRRVKATNFTSAVLLSNWNGVDFSGAAKYGNEVDVEVSACDFGVAGWGQDSPKINARGTVSISGGSPNPPHLVYLTPNAANRAPEVVANGYDHTDSDAACVQLRSVTGGKADITIRNCTRALTLFGVDDMDIDIRGTSQGDAEDGVIFFGDANSDRNRINAVIDMTAAGRAARIDGNDNMVNLTLRSNRASSTTNENVHVAGLRNTLVCKQENAASTTTGGEGIRVTGDECVIRHPEARGVRTPIVVDATADSTILEYNGDLLFQETGFNKVTDSGTNTKHYGRLSGTATWDPASIADDAMTSTTVTVTNAKAGNAVAVGFSTPVPAGALLVGSVTADNVVTVTLHNNTGGALDLASGTLTAQVFRR